MNNVLPSNTAVVMSKPTASGLSVTNMPVPNFKSFSVAYAMSDVATIDTDLIFGFINSDYDRIIGVIGGVVSGGLQYRNITAGG
jgi:hypothetical protein